MIERAASRLPASRIRLIGRENDVAELRELALRGPERLITLTGVGGCGKTSLALQVASELREAFPDGVYLVELARLSDPLLVLEAVTSSLGIGQAKDEELSDAVARALRPRALLLVLDNCEHLIDACAGLADRLLSSCAQIRILATSREPLQITGERQRRVPPLPVPDPKQAASPDELARCPSVALFLERASAVEPRFRLTAENATAVARICSVLDGIPLAVELAAARVRVLSVEQVALRLDDCFRLLTGNSRSAPTRQQTLRATLDWSYRLLTEPEQTAFRRLAVFVGGWGLEAAEAVCRGDLPGDADALELLTRLVDKSLVVIEEMEGETRYRLLEPVRQYAMERLAERGELEAATQRHAAFYLALAEKAETGLFGSEQLAWLRRVDRELDNIRITLRWAEDRSDIETSLRLAGSLHWYFWMRRHLREGLRWLEAALARGAAASPKARAKGLSGAAVVCSFLGEYPKGLAFGRDALALHRQLDDAHGQAWNHITLSHISLDLGDLPAARTAADEALVLARRSGFHWMLGHALTVLAEIVGRQGDAAQAGALYKEALGTFEEHGDRWGIGMVTHILASPDHERADFKLPAALATVQLYWERGDKAALAGALEYLAGRGEPAQAAVRVRILAAAQSLRNSLGVPPPVGEREDVERHLAAARRELGEARFAAAWAEGCALDLDQVVASLISERLAPPSAASEAPARRSRSAGRGEALTRREREVAKLVAAGFSDRKIAETLAITEGTAGVHVHHILEKLGFRSRVLVRDWALAHGLIEKPPD